MRCNRCGDQSTGFRATYPVDLIFRYDRGWRWRWRFDHAYQACDDGDQPIDVSFECERCGQPADLCHNDPIHIEAVYNAVQSLLISQPTSQQTTGATTGEPT